MSCFRLVSLTRPLMLHSLRSPFHTLTSRVPLYSVRISTFSPPANHTRPIPTSRDLWHKLRSPTFEDNMFRYFGQEVSFRVDLKALEREYRSLQMELHPDKIGDVSDRDEAEAVSSAINEGYNRLKVNHLRAEYLLSMYGRDIGEGMIDSMGDASADIVQETFMIREEISDATTREQIDEILVRVTARVAEIEEQTASAFEECDLDVAVVQTSALRYFDNILIELRYWDP